MQNDNNNTRIETCEDLEKIVAAQNEAILGLGKLVTGMDARIKVLTALIDQFHNILVQQGLAKPYEGESSLAN